MAEELSGPEHMKVPHPSVQQVMGHPSFPTTIWQLEPSQKGLTPVAKNRKGGPVNISWEIHGTGPTKIVWIMGLGAIKSAWQRQTLYFGHKNHSKYSSLVFDNRGIGLSSSPTMRYSTSEMARDLVDVLEHIGWTAPRNLHVAGVSMGGMIAQEVAMLIPERICSLSLLSTAVQIENTVGFVENLKNRVLMFMPKTLDRSVADAAASMFPDSWLTAPDDATPPEAGVAGYMTPPSGAKAYGKFSTNYERFAAQEVTKRLDTAGFGKKGFMCQALAAGWHHKSAAQLKELGDRVGRERILLLHGTGDKMISIPHAYRTREELKPGRTEIVEGSGHVLMIEKEEWFNGLIEEVIESTRKIAAA